jgi:hypothetical protein
MQRVPKVVVPSAGSVSVASRQHGAPTALLAVTAFLLACSPDPATGPTQRTQLTPRLSGDVVAFTSTALWDQSSYEPYCWIAQDRLLADDFVVPSGSTWSLSGIRLVGRYMNPLSGPFTIRADNAGTPGTILQTFTLNSVSVPTTIVGDYDFALTTPVVLSAGTYWVAMTLGAGSGIQIPCLTIHYPVNGTASMGTLSSDPTWRTLTSGPYEIGGSTDTPTDLSFALFGADETAADATTDLQTTLAGFALETGTFTSLNAKIRAALDALAAGDTAAACRALQDLINQASALAGKKLTQAEATTLIDEANRIRGLIGC